MADRNATSDYMGMLLAGEPLPASASGIWDEPPPPPPPSHNIGWYADRYLGGLPGRAREHLRAEGNRLLDLGHEGGAAQAYEMPIIGPATDAEIARREGRYPAMLGNAFLAAADASTGVASKGVRAADAALQAWKLAEGARPAQVATQAEQELKRILLLNKVKNPKPGSAAQQNRIERANGLAERAVPQPDIPPSANGSPQVAQRQLDVASREWPGKVLAGTGVAAGATGIPGVVVDDIKSGIGSANAKFQNMQDEAKAEKAAEKDVRSAPKVEGSSPEVDSYWSQLDTPRRERDRHLMAAGAMGAAGGPMTYATGKSIPWALRNMGPAAMGLGAQLAMEHPLLALIGLPLMAAGALPLAVPGGLGWGSWELAKGTAGQAEQAMKSHTEAKALTPLVRKLAENYRADQQSPPSLTPDQAY